MVFFINDEEKDYKMDRMSYSKLKSLAKAKGEINVTYKKKLSNVAGELKEFEAVDMESCMRFYVTEV
jgi:hypothetical protein